MLKTKKFRRLLAALLAVLMLAVAIPVAAFAGDDVATIYFNFYEEEVTDTTLIWPDDFGDYYCSGTTSSVGDMTVEQLISNTGISLPADHADWTVKNASEQVKGVAAGSQRYVDVVLTAPVEPAPTEKTAYLNIYDEVNKEQVGDDVPVTVPADASTINYQEVLEYIPGGYEYIGVQGDLEIAGANYVYVAVQPVTEEPEEPEEPVVEPATINFDFYQDSMTGALLYSTAEDPAYNGEYTSIGDAFVYSLIDELNALPEEYADWTITSVNEMVKITAGGNYTFTVILTAPEEPEEPEEPVVESATINFDFYKDSNTGALLYSTAEDPAYNGAYTSIGDAFVYSLIDELNALPEEYADWTITSANEMVKIAAGDNYTFTVILTAPEDPEPETVIMKVRFMCDGQSVGGGDYFLTAGVQNYSVLEQYLPEGYKLSESGDFWVEEGGKIEVRVEKIVKDVIMNVRFVDAETGEFISGGDCFLPEGVQNRNILKQYVPEGYVMTETGDFMVEEGGKIDIKVEKINKDVIMNIQFVLEDGTVVAGGDYFVPAGVQNYEVLKQYAPEGYEIAVAGDFFAVAGGELQVRVEKIVKDVIMNIRFVLADGTFIAGGDYFLPEGVQKLSILEDLVPMGYEMTEAGDFMVEEGGQRDVTVEKVSDTVIVNIAFTDRYGNVLAGGDYFVPAGIVNRSVLNQYVPAGWQLAETGDIEFVAGEHYDIVCDAATSIVNIQFVDKDGTVIAGGDYFVPTGIVNRTVLDQYVPEGYRQVVTGDIEIVYGRHYEILVEKVVVPATSKTAVFRKADADIWNENEDNPAEVRYTFWSDDADATNIVPSITSGDSTKVLDYWVSDLDETVTLKPGEEFCYNDLDQGELKGWAGEFAFYPVYKDAPVEPEEEKPTTTVTSNDNKKDDNDDVEKSTTPADNTAKVIPQTGVESTAPVAAFVIVLVAAVAGAGAYLFVVRKKLN